MAESSKAIYAGFRVSDAGLVPGSDIRNELLASYGRCFSYDVLHVCTGNCIKNGFIHLTLKGASITGLQADPKGQGGKSLGFIKDLRPEFWYEMPDTRIEVSGDSARVSPLEVMELQSISISQDTHSPVKLEPGHTLGQTFETPLGARFSSLSIKTPTWNSDTSSATLSLYKDNKLIASRRLQNVPDNSWQKLELETPQGEGIYRLEMSDPAGDIGWWSSESDVSSMGRALMDGEALDADRTLQVDIRKSPRDRQPDLDTAEKQPAGGCPVQTDRKSSASHFPLEMEDHLDQRGLRLQSQSPAWSSAGSTLTTSVTCLSSSSNGETTEDCRLRAADGSRWTGPETPT